MAEHRRNLIGRFLFGDYGALPEAKAVAEVRPSVPFGNNAGVVSRLREPFDAARIVAFNAAERSDATDASGELGFANARAAAWWHLREMLDPAHGHAVALPPDDTVTGDLTAPHWKVQSGGKILIESKDDIRKRIRRSTDAGDAVVQAFVLPVRTEAVIHIAPISFEMPSQWNM